MLKEFEQIFYRDLPTYDAIAMKAMVWMAIFCMMRLSEFTSHHHAGAHQSHTIKKENVLLIATGAQPGISVTFLSWKSSMRPQTLFFQKTAPFKSAIKWVQRYLV